MHISQYFAKTSVEAINRWIKEFSEAVPAKFQRLSKVTKKRLKEIEADRQLLWHTVTGREDRIYPILKILNQ